MTLSTRVQNIKPSPTIAITAQASELRASGKDIISLSVGEPDFVTPDHIREAAKKAIDDGFTQYTAVDGIPSLKMAIINKFHHDNYLVYQPDQIIVSTGCKQGLFNFAQAVLNEGDEVIIPAPYWVSYPDIVKLAGAVPVLVETTIDTHFKLIPEQLEEAITEKTRVLILNSPSNPTGVAYTKADLARLAEVLLKYPNVIIVTDDIYEHIWWAKEPFSNILNACPELYDRTVVFNGVSKSYAMTGWRIGYAAGPASIIKAMKKIQSQSTSNPCSIAQVAAQCALESSQQCVKDMVSAFKDRHDQVFVKLAGMQGVSTLPSDGTFYTFPNIQAVIDHAPNIKDDMDFASQLLDVGVAIVPGTAFGSPGYMRISFATSIDSLNTALSRIETFINTNT